MKIAKVTHQHRTYTANVQVNHKLVKTTIAVDSGQLARVLLNKLFSPKCVVAVTVARNPAHRLRLCT